MDFDVNTTTQFNKGSRYHSAGQRSHELAHSERYQANEHVKYYSKGNVNLSMSRFNGKPLDNMLNGKSVYQNLFDHFKSSCTAHDLKMLKKGIYRRCYGKYSPSDLVTLKGQRSLGRDLYIKRIRSLSGRATNGYLKTRWLKPIRTLPLKLGTMQEKNRLIKYCQEHNMPYEGYAKCVRQGYISWAKDFNKSSRFLKITNLHLNLDEAGGDHAHTDFLGLGRTKKGRLSLSFNNAMKIYLSKYRNDPDGYKHPVGGNYSKDSQMFIKKISTDLQKHVSKAFQSHGLDINLVQHSHGKHRNSYIENLGLWQKTQDEKRSLRQLLSSANKQNAKLKAEVNLLVKQNAKLKNLPTVSNQTLQRMKKVVQEKQKMRNYINKVLKYLFINNKRLTRNNDIYLSRLRKLEKDNHGLHEQLGNVACHIGTLNGMAKLSSSLKKALIYLSLGRSSSLTEYLTELIESEKSVNGNEPNGQSPSQRS